MKRLFLAISLMLAMSTAISQNNYWNTYTTSNSDIGGNTILTLTCDAKNNLWVGTNLGLCRLSGRTWTDYAMFNEKLDKQYVNCLTVDPDGILWIGTDDYGVIRFDGSRWTDYASETKRLNMKYVRDIAINSEGSPWIGVTLSGLVDGKGAKWKKYTAAESGLLSDFILCLQYDRQGNLWIGTNDGLCTLSPTGKWTSYTTQNSKLPTNIVPCMAIDKSGCHWIGTTGGLCRFDGHEWQVFTPKNSGLPGLQVNVIAIDAAGAIWVGTDKGVAVFDGRQDWQVFTSKKGQLPSNMVQRMVIDRKGNKWFGTDFAGLTRYAAFGIRGRVTDTRQQPVSDMVVTCGSSTATTDAQGYYYLEIPIGATNLTLTPTLDYGSIEPAEIKIANPTGFLFGQDFTYSNVITSTDKSGEKVTITPYLAEGYITIQLDSPEAEVTFLKPDGTTVRTIPAYKNNAKITIAKMPRGMYNLRIKTTKGEKNLKFNLK